MNSNLHFYHIALNFIIMKMFQTEVVEKIEKILFTFNNYLKKKKL